MYSDKNWKLHRMKERKLREMNNLESYCIKLSNVTKKNQ